MFKIIADNIAQMRIISVMEAFLGNECAKFYHNPALFVAFAAQ